MKTYLKYLTLKRFTAFEVVLVVAPLLLMILTDVVSTGGGTDLSSFYR